MIKRCNCHSPEDVRSLLYPENRILHILNVRYWNLTDELQDIFFERRPFLENPTDNPQFNDDPALIRRENQLELEKEEVTQAIKAEEARIEAERVAKLPKPTQSVLPIDSSTSGVL